LPLAKSALQSRNKMFKKINEKNAFDYKFWFEKQELVRVEKYHEEYRENDKELVARISDEYIFRISPSRTVGLHYNTYPTMPDVELDHIILCEYEGERLIDILIWDAWKKSIGISTCTIKNMIIAEKLSLHIK